jgi:hypothetical protein
MVGSVLRLIRLPLLMITIWVIARFCMGLSGVSYTPRGNAIFSVLNMTWISCFYFGAVSRRLGGFNWKGVLLIGIFLGVYAQTLIFLATLVSYLGDFKTSYFIHWDALNVAEGTVVPMSQAMMARGGGIVLGGTIFPAIITFFGRFMGRLIPASAAQK